MSVRRFGVDVRRAFGKSGTRACFWSCPVLILIALSGCVRPMPEAQTPSPGALSPVPAANAQEELRQRPLRLPALKLGAECPRAGGRQVAAAYGAAAGDGPVYVAGLGTDGILYFEYPVSHGSQFFGSTWSGNKVLWIIAPTYHGPVLIRGGRLDGHEGVRFGDGADPAWNLWIVPAATSDSAGWRNVASFTRVQSPGCYTYQVDGQGFSETIGFEAQIQP